MKELVLGLAGKLAGHVAQLGGVVDVVLQHVAQHGNGFFPAVGVVMPAVVGMLMAVGMGLPHVGVFVGMGRAVVAVVKVFHAVTSPSY